MSELYPGSLQTPAMLISKAPADYQAKIESGDYYGTIKKDGYWYCLEKTADGKTVYLFSRSKSRKTGELTEKIENVPHIKEWAEQVLNPGTVLIGEIYYPGKTSKDVTKIMGSLPQKAQQRQFNSDAFGGPIHYYIHDIIYTDGHSIMHEPYMKRMEIFKDYYDYKAFDADFIDVVTLYDSNLLNTLQDVFDAGEEGMVFKKKEGLYLPGKRPKDNFKVKTEETFDAVIIGFVEPEKQYTGKELESWQYFKDGMPVTKAYYNGWKAGVEIGAFDDEGNIKSIGTISSGMTDYLRQNMAEHPDNYLDKTVEIQAMSVNSDDYTIRHGRLIRVRDDKEGKECTLKSIFG